MVLKARVVKCGEVWCVVGRAAPPLVSLRCVVCGVVVALGQPEAAHQHLELASDLRLSGFGHRAVFAQEAASSYNVWYNVCLCPRGGFLAQCFTRYGHTLPIPPFSFLEPCFTSGLG